VVGEHPGCCDADPTVLEPGFELGLTSEFPFEARARHEVHHLSPETPAALATNRDLERRPERGAEGEQ